ncbi:hypothetical protein DPMN_079743 [Dreissena polymorpha]|uniref:Uncharacterized protein n=1 Tax=Dreissena polymorpha TaxID=45954 RepID=A0A9D3YUB2_DREPO|nr:hypothetical protein DPMN_079743 [Dreissena polymorpha]
MGDKLACAAFGKPAVCIRGGGVRREQVGGHNVSAGRTVGGLVMIRSQTVNKKRPNTFYR